MKIIIILSILVHVQLFAQCKKTDTQLFSGYEWEFTHRIGQPGPAIFSRDNVHIDDCGRMALTLDSIRGHVFAAEVRSKRSFGYGRYSFELQVDGDIDENVVVGVFSYPIPNTGLDGSNEIDIEISKWGDPKNARNIQFSVYPSKKIGRGKNFTHKFSRSINGTVFKFAYDWRPDGIYFYEESDGLTEKWSFSPSTVEQIPAMPLHVFFNVWTFKGRLPKQAIKVYIRNFNYSPQL